MLLALALACAACGQKGDLYRRDETEKQTLSRRG